MSFNMTAAQKNAVETKDKSILLSAAAGAGKTATLTNRIIASLLDAEEPMDLSRMLVVTFTRAAASELRERISAALGNALANDPLNAHLLRQSVIIGNADICTIDAFCLDLVKSNFQRLSTVGGAPLPPDFRLADETELAALRLDVMNSVIDAHYADKSRADGAFSRFADNFAGTRDEGSLISVLIKYAGFLDSVANPEDFTREAAKDCGNDCGVDFFDTHYGKLVKADLLARLDYYSDVCRLACTELNDGGICAKNYLPAFAADLAFCGTMRDAAESGYAAAYAEAGNYSPVSLKSLGKHADELTKSYQKLRGTVKKSLSELKEKYFILSNGQIGELAKKTAEELSILDSVISDYRKSYAKEKSIRRILEFSDVKRLAHDLLVDESGYPTDTARELQKRYDAIYIDEYQDVDRVQDDIFRAIARPGTLFTVGDIKQSIYGFRGADPSVFGELRASTPDWGTDGAEARGECAIYMSDNFRCNKPIIDFVNLVSRYTFRRAGGIVGYRDEDDLICRKETVAPTPVTVSLFGGNATVGRLAEANYIVDRIKETVGREHKDDGSLVGYSDIAVLSRSTSFSALVEDTLNRAGIPTENSAEKDLFANPEILLVFSLFAAIDNPHRDVTLASAMRSPFFNFSLDELVRIRAATDRSYSLIESVECYGREVCDGPELGAKCTELIRTLEALREESRILPVDRFVDLVYDRFSVTALKSSDDKRSENQIYANLIRFSDYARKYARTQSGGLTGFIDYVNTIMATGARVDSPQAVCESGAVHIMTIHKSKGLEFPVVFVGGCGMKFNREDLKHTLLFDADVGAALKLTDDTGFARTDTPQRMAIRQTIEEKQTEEEMRILYVALTRARERLFITASTPEKDIEGAVTAAGFNSRFGCRTSVMAANSYLDWLLPAVAAPQECFTLNIFQNPEEGSSDMPNGTTGTGGTDSATELDGEKVIAIKKAIAERLDYKYPYAYAADIPAKLSVSHLYPDLLDNEAEELESDPVADLSSKPLFLQTEEAVRSGAAERGTATHLFLQFCDFAGARLSVEDELARLIAERFIPSGVASLVNLGQLKRFFRSGFFNEIMKARNIYRETRFNLLLPANEFTSDTGKSELLKSENLLVQGVIDLLFTNKDGMVILCDYKTDRVPRDIADDPDRVRAFFTERHGEQLAYYSKAVEQLIGKTPDRTCIYSLWLGKAIDINV